MGAGQELIVEIELILHARRLGEAGHAQHFLQAIPQGLPIFKQ